MPCSELKGNPDIECATCGADHVCRRGAPGFLKEEARMTGSEAMAGGSGDGHTSDGGSGVDHMLTATELRDDAPGPIAELPEEHWLPAASQPYARPEEWLTCEDDDAALAGLVATATVTAAGSVDGTGAWPISCADATHLCTSVVGVAAACARSCGGCENVTLLAATASGVWQLSVRCAAVMVMADAMAAREQHAPQPASADAAVEANNAIAVGVGYPVSSHTREAAYSVGGDDQRANASAAEGNADAVATSPMPSKFGSKPIHLPASRRVLRSPDGSLSLASKEAHDEGPNPPPLHVSGRGEPIAQGIDDRVLAKCTQRRQASLAGSVKSRASGAGTRSGESSGGTPLGWPRCLATDSGREMHFHDFRHAFHSAENVNSSGARRPLTSTQGAPLATCVAARHRAAYGENYAPWEGAATPPTPTPMPHAPPPPPPPAPLPGHRRPFGQQGQRVRRLAEVAGCMQPTVFAAQHVLAHTPLLLRGCAREALPAFGKWSDEYLRETAGMHTARHPGCANTSLASFLSRYQHKERPPTDLDGGYRICNQLPRALLRDVRLPAMLRCPTVLPSVENVVMWFSGGRQKSRMHFDPNDVLIAMLDGVKEVRAGPCPGEWHVVHAASPPRLHR